LLAKGAKIEAKDSDGDTALMAAASAGKTGAVKLLLDKGANIEAKSGQGDTALILAVFFHKIDAVKMLLDKARTSKPRQPGRNGADMHGTQWPCRPRNFVAERGANIEARNNNGETALISAAGSYSENTIGVGKLLVEKGANVNAADSTATRL